MNITEAKSILAANGQHADLSKDSHDQFLNACKDGPTEVMLAYLAIGISLDARVESSKETALIKAAEGGSIERLGLLIDRGVGLELKDNSGDTALRTAFNWSHPEAARYLHSRGADLTAVNPWGEDALDHAISKESAADFALLLELGANPNFVSFNDRSAFRTALQKGREDLVEQLLNHGANPNAPLNRSGDTAMHIAVRENNSALVRLLRQHGGLTTTPDKFGATPRDYALELAVSEELTVAVGLDVEPATEAERARDAIWQLAISGRPERYSEALALIKAGGFDLNLRDLSHKSLLYRAVDAGSEEGVELLLKGGLNPNPEGEWDVCPLYAAVTQNNENIVNLLIAHGARGSNADKQPIGLMTSVWEEHEAVTLAVLKAVGDVSEKHWNDLLSSAIMKTNLKFVTMLHEHGAPLSGHKEFGDETALHQVCTHYPNLEIFDYLVKHNANLDARDSQGATPLHSLAGSYKYDPSDELCTPLLRGLLAAGARLDCVDVYARTPYTLAGEKVKPDFQQIIVLEPSEQGVSFSQLASRQNWGTLPVWYDCDRSEEVKAFINAGVAFEPEPAIKCSPLLSRVIEKQDVEMLGFLLSKGALVNRAEVYGSTALGNAASSGNIELVRLLLEHGADVNAVNDWHQTPVHNATNHLEILKLLVERGGDPIGSLVGTPLMSAVHSANLECISYLLAAGASPNVRDRYHGSMLHVAVTNDRLDIVQALLAAGADANIIAPNNGEPVLVSAAKKGSVLCVRALLESGADPTIAGRDGETGLTVFLQRKELRANFADILLKHGMDVTPPPVQRLADDVLNPSVYWRAVYSGDYTVLEKMFAQGQDPNERDRWGMTGLMHAVDAQRLDLVGLFVDHKADVEAIDKDKYPVFAYVSFQGHAQIEERLEKAAGKKLMSMDVLNGRAGRSMFAGDVRKMLERGELKKLTTLLIEQKMNPHNVQGGMSILHLALQTREEDLLEYLLAIGLTPSSRDLRETHPFVLALEQGMFAIAEKWLSVEGVSVNMREGGSPLLLYMVGRSNPDAVRWLIAHGASLDGIDMRGRTFLHACVDGYAAALALEFFDKCHAMINTQDEDHMTVLHNIMQNWYGNEALALALLNNGADVSLYNYSGMTPLHEAVMAYADQAAKMLVEHGASWDFVATDTPDACSARQLAQDRSLDPEQWIRDAVAYEPIPDNSEPFDER